MKRTVYLVDTLDANVHNGQLKSKTCFSFSSFEPLNIFPSLYFRSTRLFLPNMVCISFIRWTKSINNFVMLNIVVSCFSIQSYIEAKFSSLYLVMGRNFLPRPHQSQSNTTCALHFSQLLILLFGLFDTCSLLSPTAFLTHNYDRFRCKVEDHRLKNAFIRYELQADHGFGWRIRDVWCMYGMNDTIFRFSTNSFQPFIYQPTGRAFLMHSYRKQICCAR